MADHVHDDSACEEDHGILAIPDLDPVSVRPAEPLLRHGSHDAITARERVFVIQEIPLGLEIVGAWDINGETVMDE